MDGICLVANARMETHKLNQGSSLVAYELVGYARSASHFLGQSGVCDGSCMCMCSKTRMGGPLLALILRSMVTGTYKVAAEMHQGMLAFGSSGF